MMSEIRVDHRTRLDTRPIPIADGWAGSALRVFTLVYSIIMDGLTDQRTDKAFYRVACPQLKRNERKEREERKRNKAGYTATQVAYGWAGAVIEVT